MQIVIITSVYKHKQKSEKSPSPARMRLYVETSGNQTGPEQAMALYFAEHVESRQMDVYLGVCVALSVASRVTLE